MTIQELIDSLTKIEDKTQLVVLARDAEGNTFAPLRDVGGEDTQYRGSYSGDVEDRDDIEDMPSDAVACVVLWP